MHLTRRHVPLARAVLHLDMGVGDEVVVPDGVLGGTALGRHDGVAALVLHPHEWRLAQLAGPGSAAGENDDGLALQGGALGARGALVELHLVADRSEERRVGEEGRTGWSRG